MNMKCFILSNNNIYKTLFIIIFLMAFNVVRCNNGSEIIVKSIIPDRGVVDPHVIIVNDTLYCMFGHDKSWHTVDTWVMDRWELWATTDLTEWTHILDISPTSTYLGDKPNCWAGDFAERDGKFYWYFSNKDIDTGVMVASSMYGPWSDSLGKPLLPKGLAKTKSYDPEIIKEGDRYYIMWGAGTYYIAELDDDMVSLRTNPEMVVINDDSGNQVPTADKSCVFFRNGWYYLSWGNKYAMSRRLKGPYRFIGEFPAGGHASVFEFKGKWYAIQEKSETNIFYRGTQIRVLSFNQDGTIILSQEENDSSHVKAYNFKYSTQGWSGETGTEVKRDCPYNIYGHTTAKNAIISSTKFLHFQVTDNSKLKIRLKDVSKSKTIKVAVCSYNFDKGFF